MIAVFIYVDNQEVINYPVDFIISNLDFADKIMLFGGDEISTDYLKTLQKDNVENIDFKIKIPEDIAEAQNICIEKIKGYFDPDVIIILQADTAINETGIIEIKEWINNPTNLYISLRTMQIRMFYL